jgi:hypothetical protein
LRKQITEQQGRLFHISILYPSRSHTCLICPFGTNHGLYQS